MATQQTNTDTSAFDVLSRPVVPTERVVARLRPHGRVLFWPAAALVLGAGATAFALGFFTETWQVWTIIGVAVMWFLFACLLPYVFWLNRRYIITTRRVIARRGFFVRERTEIFHSRGYAATLRRGPLQTVFRSGNLVLSSGIDKPIVLVDVPRAELVHDALGELVERSQTAGSSMRSSAGSVGVAAPYGPGSASIPPRPPLPRA